MTMLLLATLAALAAAGPPYAAPLLKDLGLPGPQKQVILATFRVWCHYFTYFWVQVRVTRFW